MADSQEYPPLHTDVRHARRQGMAAPPIHRYHTQDDAGNPQQPENPNTIMRHQNYSVPSLPSQSHPNGENEDIPSVPPPAYEETDVLGALNNMRISDPTGRMVMNHRDPIPRAGTSMSARSATSMSSHPAASMSPHRMATMPNMTTAHEQVMRRMPPGRPTDPTRPAGAADVSSVHSVGSGGSGSAWNSIYSEYESMAYDGSVETDGTSLHSHDDSSFQHHSPSNRYMMQDGQGGYAPPRGYPSQQGWENQHPGYATQGPPPGQNYNSMYAAASNLLGMGPPPGGALPPGAYVRGPPPRQASMNYAGGPPPQQAPGQYPPGPPPPQGLGQYYPEPPPQQGPGQYPSEYSSGPPPPQGLGQYPPGPPPQQGPGQYAPGLPQGYGQYPPSQAPNQYGPGPSLPLAPGQYAAGPSPSQAPAPYPADASQSQGPGQFTPGAASAELSDQYPPAGSPPQGPAQYLPEAPTQSSDQYSQLPPQQYYSNNGPPQIPPNMPGSYLGAGPYRPGTPSIYSGSSQASLGRAPSIAPSSMSTDEEVEFRARPSLQRSGTTASFAPRTQKSKAIDLSAPPFTKEYIDEYRHRIKDDPDPEAHFSYAKYLIEAAKKFGQDAKDQKSVKRYRDTLIAESLKVMRRLATQGNGYDEAQFFLANCHGTGMLGLPVDHERAYHLYLQAAKQNHAAACYRVAVCNEIGAGTRKEPRRALAFYRKAASLGDTAAMYKLGCILLRGSLGEQENPRDAVNWLKRAAEQADEENPHALHELAMLFESPNNKVVPYDPAYAKELYTRAGHLGYTHSQYKLGQCYEYGSLTCPVDPRRSIAWYTKAAEKGHSEAFTIAVVIGG